MTRRARSASPPAPARGARTSPYPRLLIAGLSSDIGKTSVTAAILAAFAREHVPLAAFKCGPDYLDPQVLRGAGGLGRVGNLDLWLSPPQFLRRDFLARAVPEPPGLTLVEGVMGLFDTRSWGTSTWDVARLLHLPIVLVVDASRSVESVAALVRGTVAMLPKGCVVGAIVNRAGRGWHAQTVRSEIERTTRVPVLGVLPYSQAISTPSQHLGLGTPDTRPEPAWKERFRAMASWGREHLDLEGIRAAAGSARPLMRPEGTGDVSGAGKGPAGGLPVAVATDAAFCFTYSESLEALGQRGSALLPFSPLRGDPIPPSAGAVYLPGGYPELHAERLADHEGLLRELRQWVRDGRPLYAECGGMMLLLESLIDLEGKPRRMAGAFPGRTRMRERLVEFGYVEATVRRTCPAGPPGARLRGHLFHHSEREVSGRVSWSWETRPRHGGPTVLDGYSEGRALAGYLHLRLDAHPLLIEALTTAKDGSGPLPPGIERAGEERRR